MFRSPLTYSISPATNGEEVTPEIPDLCSYEFQEGLLRLDAHGELRLLMLEFIADPDDVKPWLAQYARQYVVERPITRTDSPEPPSPYASCILMTSAGYDALGFSPGAFTVGARTFPGLSKNGGVENPAACKRSPHAVLILGGPRECELNSRVQELVSELDGLARVRVIEPRKFCVEDEDLPGEFVCYRDTLITPILPPLMRPPAGSIPSPIEHQLSFHHLLVPDPYAERGRACGAYFVITQLANPGHPDASGYLISGGLQEEYYFAPSLSFFRSLDRY